MDNSKLRISKYPERQTLSTLSHAYKNHLAYFLIYEFQPTVTNPVLLSFARQTKHIVQQHMIKHVLCSLVIISPRIHVSFDIVWLIYIYP